MYKSPISVNFLDKHVLLDKCVSDLLEAEEQYIIRYLQDMEIYVDKEELIKALQYDRDQYRKGFHDGVIDFIQKSGWISASERLPEIGKKVLCLCQANIYEVLALTSEGWYHDRSHCYMRGFVVAWRPLPEPYGAEEGEADEE